jgi:hypothetical protein
MEANVSTSEFLLDAAFNPVNPVSTIGTSCHSANPVGDCFTHSIHADIDPQSLLHVTTRIMLGVVDEVVG